jgi:hypothetical protein
MLEYFDQEKPKQKHEATFRIKSHLSSFLTFSKFPILKQFNQKMPTIAAHTKRTTEFGGLNVAVPQLLVLVTALFHSQLQAHRFVHLIDHFCPGHEFGVLMLEDDLQEVDHAVVAPEEVIGIWKTKIGDVRSFQFVFSYS